MLLSWYSQMLHNVLPRTESWGYEEFPSTNELGRSKTSQPCAVCIMGKLAGQTIVGIYVHI